MPKRSKNTAYLCIVSIGFLIILFLYLPTFVASIKSITQETSFSSSRVTKKISQQSEEIFKDTGKKLQEKLKKLEEEKKKKDALQATVTSILKEHIPPSSFLQTVSSSSSTNP